MSVLSLGVLSPKCGAGVWWGRVGCRLLSLSQFLSERKFQEVAFYNFIQKYSVIKFAKLTVDTFDCIKRVKPFSPILSIYVIFLIL